MPTTKKKMHKTYDDGKVLIRWDEDVKVEKTNFWELFRLQLHLSAISIPFGICVMLLIGLATSQMLRGTCAHVLDDPDAAEDWTVLKENFFQCALNHWSSILLYKPIVIFNYGAVIWLTWGTQVFRTGWNQALLAFTVVGAYALCTTMYVTNAKALKYHEQLDGSKMTDQSTLICSYWYFAHFCVAYFGPIYLLIKNSVRKGSGFVTFLCMLFESGGFFVYSSALEVLLNRGTPVWQIVLFRYVFHEIFWGVVLWGYRIVLRNCLGLDTGAQGLLIGRLVTMKAIYSKFLLVQLKGFGQIIAINIFDALLNFFLRSLYVIYDEWFMNMQYGNRAAKAIISTEEESYLRSYEAQAETMASAPAVFITGGLLLFGHFQPVPGQSVNIAKVVIDIVVQLITNFTSDWFSMVAEDKFFASQHVKVFNRRMPNWSLKMMAMQCVSISIFMLGSGYAPFCPKRYEHGIMMEYCG